MSARGITASCLSMLANTRSMYSASGQSSTAWAISSCSACENRSMATQSGLVEPSAITRISEGPATMSMPTTPKTRRLAAATYALPGPTILSTAGIVSVPNASAPTACAPPMRNTRSTPASAAAARTVAFICPSGVGVTMMSCLTPATLAAMAFISTDDGYAALPPGTYRPARSSAVICWPSTVPSASVYCQEGWIWRS